MKREVYPSEEAYRAAKKKERERYYAKYAFSSEKDGKWFSEEEDALILSRALPDTKLAKVLNRPLKSIQLRRVRLKKEGKVCQ